jgi:hypothetical protein
LKKKIFCISFGLVLLLSLTLIPAVPASAAAIYLSATGDPAGQEARVVVGLPSGTTLGDIDSISWDEYLVKGYPPHVDIILDLDDDGIADDALVVEYAYNLDAHYYDNAQVTGDTAYDAEKDAWYATFSDDGDGPTSVTDTTFAWLSSGAPGPYPVSGGLLPIGYGSVDGNFVGGTLAEWKAGSVVPAITSSDKVLRLEIEIDNWIIDTQAYVDNIKVNGDLSSAVGLEVDVPDIVAISVDPTTIDFGTLLPGDSSSSYYITVENVGTRTVDVDASVIGSSTMIANNLWLRQSDGSPGWNKGTDWLDIILGLTMGDSEELQTYLEVPGDHTPAGTETATLVFEATAS